MCLKVSAGVITRITAPSRPSKEAWDGERGEQASPNRSILSVTERAAQRARHIAAVLVALEMISGSPNATSAGKEIRVPPPATE